MRERKTERKRKRERKERYFESPILSLIKALWRDTDNMSGELRESVSQF